MPVRSFFWGGFRGFAESFRRPEAACFVLCLVAPLLALSLAAATVAVRARVLPFAGVVGVALGFALRAPSSSRVASGVFVEVAATGDTSAGACAGGGVAALAGSSGRGGAADGGGA